MTIKFRDKPYVSKYFTVLLHDGNNTTEDKITYWNTQYALPSDILDLGKKGSVNLFHIGGNKETRSYALVDLSDKFGREALLQTLLDFALAHLSEESGNIQVDYALVDAAEVAPATVQALELSKYELSMYSTVSKPAAAPANIVFITSPADAKVLKGVVAEEQLISRYQKEVMNLVNAPSNKLNTAAFVAWIKKGAKKTKLKVSVLNKAQMKQKKLHAVLAVNQGSAEEPAFVIAEYAGNKSKDAKTIGLVGKGVTFDTGGLSIKPSQNLHYMKSDMGGAAAVLGTIAAIADLNWPVTVIAITPITDNCVDANSIKPGDVIESYSGKTIEIIDTDAEGRLILADALSYMVKNYDVDHVIDLATLTGSVVRTFGTACAGLFCNDEELADGLETSGSATGERLWQLPIWEEYDSEMKSDIADIKNLSTRPMAGAITAAKFLQAFTLEHPSWAHLDIAGVAFGDTKFGKGKSATGYGVHLLCHFIKEHGN